MPGAGLFTVAVAALACFLPARQAGKLPPPPLCRQNDRGGHPPPSLKSAGAHDATAREYTDQNPRAKMEILEICRKDVPNRSLVQILQPWGNRCNA